MEKTASVRPWWVFALPALALVCAVWISAFAVSPAAAADELEAIMQRIAGHSAEEVGFREERFLGVVTKPLKSAGTLRFDPPDTLVKKTETPFRETVVVEKDRLTVFDEKGQETHSISLWASEEMRTVFDGLRAVLRGDTSVLRQMFDIELARREAGWQLDLTPTAGQEESQIRQIRVQGKAGSISSFDIREANGDRALIRLTDVAKRS